MDTRDINEVKFTGHGDYLEMGLEEKNISGSRHLVAWMLLS